MKRKTIRVIFIIIGCYLPYCLVFRSNYHHCTAADYQKIINKLHVNLPDIADVDSWDNYDRGASRWDCLEHKIKLVNPLSEKTINQLERKAARSWNKWYRECCQTSMVYTYRSEESWESDAYFYHCDIVDDLEGDNGKGREQSLKASQIIMRQTRCSKNGWLRQRFPRRSRTAD